MEAKDRGGGLLVGDSLGPGRAVEQPRAARVVERRTPEQDHLTDGRVVGHGRVGHGRRSVRRPIRSTWCRCRSTSHSSQREWTRRRVRGPGDRWRGRRPWTRPRWPEGFAPAIGAAQVVGGTTVTGVTTAAADDAAADNAPLVIRQITPSTAALTQVRGRERFDPDLPVLRTSPADPARTCSTTSHHAPPGMRWRAHLPLADAARRKVSLIRR